MHMLEFRNDANQKLLEIIFSAMYCGAYRLASMVANHWFRLQHCQNHGQAQCACCHRLTAWKQNRKKIKFDSISVNAKYQQQQQQDIEIPRKMPFHSLLRWQNIHLRSNQTSNNERNSPVIPFRLSDSLCTRWILVWRVRSTSLSPFHVLLSVWLLSKLQSLHTHTLIIFMFSFWFA